MIPVLVICDTWKTHHASPSCANFRPRLSFSLSETERHSEELSLQAPFHSCSLPQGFLTRNKGVFPRGPLTYSNNFNMQSLLNNKVEMSQAPAPAPAPVPGLKPRPRAGARHAPVPGPGLV